MKFLGLKIFIWILEVAAFLLITPCLIVIGWALFGGDRPLSGRSVVQAAIAVGVVGGVLLIGVVLAALASVLEVLLAIELNTAKTVQELLGSRAGPTASLAALTDEDAAPSAKLDGTVHRFIE